MRRLSVPLLVLFPLGCSDPHPPVPCNAALPNHIVHVEERVRVNPCFEAETLPLTYKAASTDPSIVSVTAERIVRITGEGIGEVVVTITATDGNGLSASQIVHVTVPNRPPEFAALPSMDLPLWAGRRIILSRYITDPDRQALAYRVDHTGGAVQVQLLADTLDLYAAERGEVGLTIEATDPSNSSVQQIYTGKVGDPVAYITQAAHSRRMDVPLVANRDGLLRLFLATDSFRVAMPRATATLYERDGTPLRRMGLSALSPTTVPLDITEGEFASSLNTTIEGGDLAPAARLVIEVEPTIDPGMIQRIDMPLDVADLPDLELTLVPVVFGSDESATRVVDEIIAQGAASPHLSHLLRVLPVQGMVLRLHESPIRLSEDPEEPSRLLSMLTVLWQSGGRRGYYMGVIPRAIGGNLHGAAYFSGPLVSFARAQSTTIGHEMGHNLGLLHTACGGPAKRDPNFPSNTGAIGVWGYSFRTGQLISPKHADIMGYCSPVWISDYHFDKALNFRRTVEPTRRSSTHAEPVLVIWGWIGADGTPVLEPAFYATGIPTRVAGSTHRIRGQGPDGDLFAYDFSPYEVADGPGGGASFVHFVPVTWGGEDLTEIALDGPTGSAVLDSSTDRPLSIVMREGQVESITFGTATPELSTDHVIFSRGIPRRTGN